MATQGSAPDMRALLKEAYLTVEKLKARVDLLEREKSEPIAVVGIGCRLPGGVDSADAYWDLLRNGVDAIREVPRDRWDIDEYYDANPDAPDKMYTRWGGFVDQVDAFDPQFFGISPREATAMDPQQRLLLEVAWEALEHAGIRPDSLAGSATGVFLGISTSDYADLLASATGQANDLYAGTGNSFSIASGRLSYVLGLQGPCMSVDTACSASLLAVHLAAESLRRKECSLALVGGVNLMLAPALTAVMCRGRMLSFDGRCKTFDAAADGYVRGEGCGVVVLRRLSDAQAAGQRILAVVKGSAVNQDGRSSGLTAPSGLAQEALLRAALKNAGVAARQVGYVEAHGTGTSLGDPIEMRALGAVMGDQRPADRPLLVGAVKTNIGHLEAAAGVASFIKAVLVLQHGEIPPHLHFKTPSPHIAWHEAPVRIATALQPWPHADERRLAGVSAFGFSGTNAHVILEAAPVRPFVRTVPDRPLHVLPLSGRTDAALAEGVQRFAGTLAASAQALADIAFTAANGRAHLRHRLAVVAGDTAAAASQLGATAAGGRVATVARGVVPEHGAPKVAFLFTGQGSQYLDMGGRLFETAPVFRAALLRCDELFRPHLGESLTELLYGQAAREERDARLGDTKFTQPALFALEFALAELWRSWGVKPLAVMGHSLGEYVAACVAGVFSLEDATALVAARARLMSALPAGGRMAAVFAPAAVVAAVAAPFAASVSIAAENGPDSVVISGAGAEVTAVTATLETQGISVKPLTVSHAFHSPLMAPMLAGFDEVLRTVTFNQPRIRVISNLTGKPADPNEITRPDYWRQHVLKPVLFAPSVAWLHSQEFRTFVEVGPQATLAGMAARFVADPSVAWLPSLRKDGGDWEQMLRTVAELYVRGVDIDWAAFDDGYARQRVTIPTYPFQRQRYWVEGAARRAPAATETTPPLADWLYEVEWQPAAALSAADRLPGVWLLFADRRGIASGVAAQLERAGATCHVVPSDGAIAVDAAVEQARARGPLAGVLHLSSLDVETDALDVDGLERAQEATCGSVLSIIHALAATSSGAPPRLAIVTRGAVPAGGTDARIEAAQGSVWGLARVAALEQPQLRVLAIDLDPATDTDPTLLVSELAASADENQVALRAGRRYVARLTRSSRAAESLRPDAAVASAEGVPLDLSADGTYLVTGGAGGLGLRVAAWLVGRHARHVVLTGRSHPAPDAAEAMHALRAAGATITFARADISHERDVRRLLDDIAATPYPLRGIIHAAGVLDDGMLTHMTWPRFQAVMAPKVRGGWLLHQLTERDRLDFFVLFSSASAVLGAPGQASYAAANAFLDSLAQYRRSRGAPALSVDWGAWSDVGMAARLQGRDQSRLAARGIGTITPDNGIAILDGLLRSPMAQVLAIPIRWDVFVASLAGNVSPLLRGLAQHAATLATGAAPASAALRRTLEAAPAAERAAMIAVFVHAQVGRVLGANPEQIEGHAAFDTMGVDSLMVVELRNVLSAALELDVPVAALYEHGSVGSLSAYLTERLDSPAGPAPVMTTSPRLKATDAAALLSTLGEIPDDKIDALLDAMLAEQETHHD